MKHILPSVFQWSKSIRITGYQRLNSQNETTSEPDFSRLEPSNLHFNKFLNESHARELLTC